MSSPTPRIAPLDPPYVEALQQHFDRIMSPGAPPLVLFRTIATSERAWRRFTAGSLLDRGPLSLREREIVIDRTCALTGCEYEWGVHVAVFATPAKLSADEVRATVTGAADAPCWSAREQALITAVDALHHRATWSRAEFDALKQHFDDAQVLEIIQLCGFYRTVSYFANALDLPLEPTAARFAEQG
jgi:alkylhydroperoxidase family enzyme